jgi:hypothetical protein
LLLLLLGLQCCRKLRRSRRTTRHSSRCSCQLCSRLLELLLLLPHLRLDHLPCSHVRPRASKHGHSNRWHEATVDATRRQAHPQPASHHLLLDPVMRQQAQRSCCACILQAWWQRAPRGTTAGSNACHAAACSQCILQHAHASQLLLHVLCHDHKLWRHLLLLL